MKRYFTYVILTLCSLSLYAQTSKRTFEGKLVNKEHNIYLRINFYEPNITVPAQELYGELPGYLGDEKDNRVWLITDAELKNKRTAILTLVNDYGSEDLTATLTCNDDGTYTLKQNEGSCLKVVRNRKFTKLPKSIVFKK